MCHPVESYPHEYFKNLGKQAMKHPTGDHWTRRAINVVGSNYVYEMAWLNHVTESGNERVAEAATLHLMRLSDIVRWLQARQRRIWKRYDPMVQAAADAKVRIIEDLALQDRKVAAVKAVLTAERARRVAAVKAALATIERNRPQEP